MREARGDGAIHGRGSGAGYVGGFLYFSSSRHSAALFRAPPFLFVRPAVLPCLSLPSLSLLLRLRYALFVLLISV